MLSKEILTLTMRETVSRSQLIRTPLSPENLLDEEFEAAQETVSRALAPIFHFNALATSRLVPPRGLLLALGSGIGHYLVYLAQRRPDIQIIGVDPDERTVILGQHFLTESGVADRVSISHCDITNFVDRIPGQVDMITSVLSLNQLPSMEDLTRCFHQISLARIRNGSAVWLFDFARPKSEKTAQEFPATLMPGTSPQFRREYRNALTAAFNYSEMTECLDKVSQGTVNHANSKPLSVYQAHWMESDNNYQAKNNDLWQEGKMSELALQQFKQICTMLPKVPLPPHLK